MKTPPVKPKKNLCRYLRQTIAPNIREKRKVENKFIKYSKAELINQIKNVLKPETDVEENVDTLLLNSLAKKLSQDDPNKEGMKEAREESFPSGSVALLEGQLNERRVGVAIDTDTVQLYFMTRYGLEPEDTTEDMTKWKVLKIIEDYDYVKRRTREYLVCSLT